MLPRLMKIARMAGVAGVIAFGALAIFPGSSEVGPYASTLDDAGVATPVAAKCANKKCVTSCWADRCEHNSRTYCQSTERNPCSYGRYGCLTYSC